MPEAAGRQEGAGPAELLAFAQAAGEGSLAWRMGLRLVEVSPARVVGTMPVTGNTQPHRLLHGGASCVLAEELASLGSYLHAGEGRTAVGIEINASHHRAARTGSLTGVATALHRGRTVATYDVAISDDQGHRVCTARVTCALLDVRR